MNKDTAKDLVARFENINRLIFAVLPDFETRLTHEEYKILKRAVARMGVMADSHIYAALLDQYPELNPLKDKGSEI